MSYNDLPQDLPVPQDDGACSHLLGLSLPNISLPSTSYARHGAAKSSSSGSGKSLDLFQLPGKVVLFIYPATGTPGVALPEGWNAIAGARGCTPESLSFKDHFQDFTSLGYTVYGLSSQSPEAHREARERLELPYDLLSDAKFEFASALGLPTFTTAGKDGNGKGKYLKRVTLVVSDGVIEHVIYPVFPTDQAAAQVLKLITKS